MMKDKVKKIENRLKDEFDKINEICLYNSEKILNAFIKENTAFFFNDFSAIK